MQGVYFAKSPRLVAELIDEYLDLQFKQFKQSTQIECNTHNTYLLFAKILHLMDDVIATSFRSMQNKDIA
jgi:hypothetical protein